MVVFRTGRPHVMGRAGRIHERTSEMSEDLRRELTKADFLAAGVEPPQWDDDPIPTLETWKRWEAAEKTALAFKQAKLAAVSAA